MRKIRKNSVIFTYMFFFISPAALAGWVNDACKDNPKPMKCVITICENVKKLCNTKNQKMDYDSTINSIQPKGIFIPDGADDVSSILSFKDKANIRGAIILSNQSNSGAGGSYSVGSRENFVIDTSGWSKSKTNQFREFLESGKDGMDKTTIDAMMKEIGKNKIDINGQDTGYLEALREDAARERRYNNWFEPQPTSPRNSWSESPLGSPNPLPAR